MKEHENIGISRDPGFRRAMAATPKIERPTINVQRPTSKSGLYVVGGWVLGVERWALNQGKIVLMGFVWFGLAASLLAAQPAARFPKPDFETGYVEPRTQCPVPRSSAMEWVDVAVLAGTMGAVAWLALKKRSRAGVLSASIFSIGYFGFYRKGCICSVGAIQNVAAAIGDPSYVVPWTAVLFFVLPLAFALFFGRVFCAAVCPLGAIQDVVVRKPLRLPPVVAGVLGFVPWVYLGGTALLALLGAGFVICRYDPFIAVYRLGGPVGMLLGGAALLILGIFVARPYCRFLCPYGVLLNIMSRFAARHVTITPDKCVNCRLCEDACPFDCIRPRTPDRVPESKRDARRRLAQTAILMPAVVAAGVWAGVALHGPLARLHPDVRLAERVALEERGAVKGYTPESEAFRGTGVPVAALYSESAAVVKRFRTGASWVGGLLGLVLACRLVGLSLWTRREEYTIDKGTCLSCGRCFEYCPVGRPPLKDPVAGGGA